MQSTIASRSRGLLATFTALALAALVTTACSSPPASTAATQATAAVGTAAAIEGPVTTGQVAEPLTALPSDLAAHGYEEQEFFASGTAKSYSAIATPSNGRWKVRPSASAAFKTRILVRRPVDPARFNGTVVVEWMNVSAGESAPDWDYLNPYLMANGYAWVGVSAQAIAVNGGTPLLGSLSAASAKGLVGADPARYGSLHHPGDRFAFDLFAQIGAALRVHGAEVLGAHPAHVVGVGESQSAFYLTTYADAIQPLTGAYDGLFIHSRGGSGASLAGTSITSSQAPANLRIRTDLAVPVFMFETQTDLIELGYAPAQQPDTARIRTWEVAGTSHADAYLVGAAAGVLGCSSAVNSGPQHDVVQAAFAAFSRWVTGGTSPPTPHPFQLSATTPAALALDPHGNVIGGVRTPAVDVPISTLSGTAPAGTTPICSLFGSTTPFGPAELTTLYGTPADYVGSFTRSLDRSIAGGYLLAADRSALVAQAAAVTFPVVSRS